MSSEAAAVADIEQWRKTRDQKCRDPAGYLTLVGLHWLKKGANTVGRTEDNAIQFLPTSCPDHLGTVTLGENDDLSFTPHPGVNITIGGAPVKESVTLKSDFPEEDQATTLVVGTISWFVVKRGARYGLRVRDSESEVVKNFAGVDNYPINLSLRLDATFVPHKDGIRKIKVLNALGDYEEEESHGHVAFSVNKTPLTLLVTGDIKKRCMIVFGDATAQTGDTYPGGRFLWIDPPKDGHVLLDFNKAYNPPCVFTPWATCSLPLAENRLSVRIEAGEKVYGDH